MSQARHSSARRLIRRRSFLIVGGVTGGGLVTLAGGVELDRLLRQEPKLFGVSVEGSSTSSIEQMTTLCAALGRKVNVVNIYVAWGWNRPFPTDAVEGIASQGAVPEITWEPWEPDEDKNDQPNYRLSELKRHAAYVSAFADACARYSKPLYLRFAHEMNSDWYPWSVIKNDNSPVDYVAAHRQLHEQFQRAGATNVRWVWCPNVIYLSRADLIMDSYPGNDVVDVVALDGYNRGGKDPLQVFGPSLTLLRGLAPSKPLWINEVGTAAGDDEGKWIKSFFHLMARTGVECVVWFEVSKPSAPDWRLLRNTSTADAAREALARW